MNQENIDDKDFVQKASDGDTRAIQALFEQYSDLLYAYIHHQTDYTPAEVDDIWQETMMSAFRSLKSYRAQSSYFTWLCSIAKHKIIDHYRKNKKQFNILPEGDQDKWLEILDTQPLPEEIVLKKEVQIMVIQALAELPAEYRILLVEQYTNRLSIQEIADKLNKSYKAIESQLARARQALRKIIMDEQESF